MPPMPSAMPVGQFGATGPWLMDSRVKVSTPPSEVTKVEARAAGATPPADPVDAAGASGQGGQDDQRGSRDAADGPGRLVRVEAAGGAGGGQPDAEGQQEGGDHQVEDAGAG